jgi:hypothetical protein
VFSTAARAREQHLYAQPTRLLRDENGEPLRIVHTGPVALREYSSRNLIKQAVVRALIRAGVRNPLGADMGELADLQAAELRQRNEGIRQQRESS